MFDLQDSAIDSQSLRLKMMHDQAGAFACFEGWVRNHNEGRGVLKLAYEAYTSLALKEGRLIMEEAMAEYDILDAYCVHRVGQLEIGDSAVWVGVSSAHRDAAFAACRTIIDEVKLRVPIWKNESYPEGDSGWINAEYEAHQKSE